MKAIVQVAHEGHTIYAELICHLMEESAKQRGTGIAKRSPEYICKKINQGQAVIALDDETLAGFCYIETWSHGQYVANSGLIVHPDYRSSGLAREIKRKIFEHSRSLFPEAKIFGITTSLPVMKINSDLGYRPVPLTELTTDDAFWKGCESCKNYDILTRTNRSHCLCTGMLFDPARHQGSKDNPEPVKKKRWEKFKEYMQERMKRISKNKFTNTLNSLFL